MVIRRSRFGERSLLPFGWDLVEWLDRLTADAKVATACLQSQHPPNTVDLRGGRWSSVEKSTLNNPQKIPHQKINLGIIRQGSKVQGSKDQRWYFFKRKFFIGLLSSVQQFIYNIYIYIYHFRISLCFLRDGILIEVSRHKLEFLRLEFLSGFLPLIFPFCKMLLMNGVLFTCFADLNNRVQ